MANVEITDRPFGIYEFCKRIGITIKTCYKYIDVGLVSVASINPSSGRRVFTQVQVDEYFKKMSGNCRPESLRRLRK